MKDGKQGENERRKRKRKDKNGKKSRMEECIKVCMVAREKARKKG